MKPVTVAFVGILLAAGFAAAGDVSAEQEDSSGAADTVDIAHTTDGTTVTVEGVYMAPDASYTVSEKEIVADGDTLVATITITSSDDPAATVVTPVNFAATATPAPGTYDLEQRVTVDGDVRFEQRVTDAVEITGTSDDGGADDADDTGSMGILGRIIAWFGGLF